jgi:hypothetical protein
MQVEVWQFLRAFLFLTRAIPTTLSDMSECSRYFGARRAIRGNTSSSPMCRFYFVVVRCPAHVRFRKTTQYVHSRIESISDILMITSRRDACATVNYEPDSFDSRGVWTKSWKFLEVTRVLNSQPSRVTDDVRKFQSQRLRLHQTISYMDRHCSWWENNGYKG